MAERALRLSSLTRYEKASYSCASWLPSSITVRQNPRASLSSCT